MTAHFDLILRNGTVVNHDGTAVRDIAISGERIAGTGRFHKERQAASSNVPAFMFFPGS